MQCPGSACLLYIYVYTIISMMAPAVQGDEGDAFECVELSERKEIVDNWSVKNMAFCFVKNMVFRMGKL